MEIEIYADVVCPWCWIGKRRMEQALESYNHPVTVRYRPFQLDPRPVAHPQPLLDALADKFGGPDRARAIAAQVTGVAASVGITMNFDRAVAANTFDAHRLVRFASGRGREAELVEALYRAHFTEGVDVGDHAALVTLAVGVGLDRDETAAFLTSTADAAEVRAELEAARELGVSSVPTFVLAGRYAVTGAQEPATLRAALDEVTRRETGS
ncbi:DsbA family oxidoreductase [Micromonospora echinofusca]|uniref:Thioredoxin domain-containing protein n=1 Tax=Micromonospora echinofusca TaxID=47858 RepID=A0ABS3VJ81_MICEH|nr:DsbA family oxidoreductase [Micromonospora echinofusca]MBO4204536.1 thioredoxin domain-containing protein [Micromonospora echinofusca]